MTLRTQTWSLLSGWGHCQQGRLHRRRACSRQRRTVGAVARPRARTFRRSRALLRRSPAVSRARAVQFLPMRRGI
eukprot:14090415-Alexandrium_andersonii.AAC.1